MLSPNRKNIHQTHSLKKTLSNNTESIKTSSTYQLMSDVDYHVKTMISDILHTLGPEDKINHELTFNIKEIKKNFKYQNDIIPLSPKCHSPILKSNLHLNSSKTFHKLPHKVTFKDIVNKNTYTPPQQNKTITSNNFNIELIPISKEDKVNINDRN